jgi:Family of unknown function (DUF6370)
MKKRLLALLAVASLVLTSTSMAEDHADAKKLKLVVGDGQCAKCSLKETKTCQNAIQVTSKDGKKMIYLLEANDVSKKFHGEICSTVKKVAAFGSIKEVDGKHVLVAHEIASIE